MLPAKHEKVIRCTLTDLQIDAYLTVLDSPEVQQVLGQIVKHRMDFKFIDRSGRCADGGLVSGVHSSFMTDGMKNMAFRAFNELRMVCNHVDLWKLRNAHHAEGGSKGYISFRSNNAVNAAGSGKLLALKALLAKWHQDREQNHKVLIFSQFRMVLDVLENFVEQEHYTYMRMDGTTATKSRSVLIDRFNTDPNIFIALLTTRVGGLGVNLTGADRVVIFDPDWNPTTDEQARERSWRIGQTREVCVYRLITTGTIEEHILHRQLSKMFVTDKVLVDPTLQRSFSTNSVRDTLSLGGEYMDRVAPSHRHHVMLSLKNGDVGTSSRIAQEVQHAVADRNRHDIGGSTFKVVDETDMDINGVGEPRLVDVEEEELGNRADEDDEEHEHSRPSLFDPEEDAVLISSTNDHNGRRSQRGEEQQKETALLQQMADGESVSMPAGVDPLAERLAIAAAQTRLRRLTQQPQSPNGRMSGSRAEGQAQRQVQSQRSQASTKRSR